MSKITNDGLTRSGTGCFIAVLHMATVGVKGLTAFLTFLPSSAAIERLFSAAAQLRVLTKHPISISFSGQSLMSISTPTGF